MKHSVLWPAAIHSNTGSNTISARWERRHLAGSAQASQPAFMKIMIDLLVNYNEFWARLSEDIRSAQRSVFVQTFAFEGDAIGKELSVALLSSTAPDRRVLADSFTRMVLSDRFRYSPANLFDDELRHEARETATMKGGLKSDGVKIRFTNP
jgi:phosphatidylserine/phosphatidylglycerophosphate/cardiolipin synthase-like enzyme